jgi:hypothetical protein
MIIELIAADGVLLSSAVLLLRAAEAERQRRTLTAYELRFPRGLESERVESFFAGLSGLLLPAWKRWITNPVVVLEVHASSEGLRHYLLVPGTWSRAVEGILQAAAPSIRCEPNAIPFVPLNVGAEYRMTTHQRSLRIDTADLNAKLLATLQPLYGSETVVVQLLLSAHGPVAPARVMSKNDNQLLSPSENVLMNAEAAAALRQKQSEPLLLATPRIGVEAEQVGRARALLRQAEAAWHQTRAPGIHLARRLVSEATIAKRMIQRKSPLVGWPTTLNSDEATGLSGWPIDAVAVPGLNLGSSRLIPASPAIPTTGTVIADANFPSEARPLAVDVQGRLRHIHVLGPTGTGKSTLLVNMAVQDLEAGRGLVLLDPKGDLVENVLDRVPEDRREDVIVLDPADSARPVGLNPLQSVDEDHAEVVVENLVGLFKSLYRYSWGPRLDDILRAALLTLASAKGTTLCEVPLILTDPSYRRRLVGRLDDPIGLESFWGWYESISEAERQLAVSPVLNKVRAFTMRPRVRSIIGQSVPKLTMRSVLEEKKVLLVSLASGVLGDEAAALMGALVVAELWNATLARSALAPERRSPVMAYLDEWQHFLHLPTPMSSVLAEARGLGLGMVLAHQELGQLPEDVRRSVLANARSKVVFQLPSGDAHLMAKEFGGVLTADDLQGLGAYEVALQLFSGGTTQAVVTGGTRSMVDSRGSADDIRRRSRERHGVERAEVDQQIRERQRGRQQAPTGRRRRSGGAS